MTDRGPGSREPWNARPGKRMTMDEYGNIYYSDGRNAGVVRDHTGGGGLFGNVIGRPMPVTTVPSPASPRPLPAVQPVYYQAPTWIGPNPQGYWNGSSWQPNQPQS